MEIFHIENKEVSAICFVQDYVELHFDGPVLRLLANPTIETEAGHVRFPDKGSRSELCALIGDRVVNIELEEEKHVQLRFASGRKIFVRFYRGSNEPPESMHFVAGIK